MTTPAEPAGGRIALVDDDAVFLRLLSDNLRAAGHDPVCYMDPRRALAALQAPPAPDACIFDWSMPEIDGLSLLARLRRSGFRAPVLFLSSHSRPIFEAAALDAGAADCIDKARGPAFILHRLGVALTRSATAPQADDPPADDLLVGELLLRRGSRRALWRGRDVALSRGEFAAVALLAERAGEDVGYREIDDVLRGGGFEGGPDGQGYRARVRDMVKRIRHAFTDIDPGFAALDSYPGFGYRWQKGL